MTEWNKIYTKYDDICFRFVVSQFALVVFAVNAVIVVRAASLFKMFCSICSIQSAIDCFISLADLIWSS